MFGFLLRGFTALAAPRPSEYPSKSQKVTAKQSPAGTQHLPHGRKCHNVSHLKLFHRQDDDEWWHGKHTGHGRLNWQAYRDGIIACSMNYRGKGVVDYGLAAKSLKTLDSGHCYHYIGGHPKDMLQRVWPVFFNQGRVGEADRRGVEPIFSKEDALEVSELLKGGKIGSMKRGGKKVERLVYFTSMAQAVREVPRLQEIQKQYNASPAQMLAAAKYWDPDLQRRTVTYHPDFSAEQLQDRIDTAGGLLDSLPSVQYSRRQRLDRFIWADEGSVLLSDLNLSRVKVWCSKHNFNLHDIVSLPEMQGKKDCKVWFFIVLSSHPAFAKPGGVVYWEFTTGTDNIRRVSNTMGQTQYEPFGYTTLKGRDAEATVTAEAADNVYLAVNKFIDVTGEYPILVMDNIKIQANIPDQQITSRYGTLFLPTGCRIRIPTYSPDFNQVAEHGVAHIKREVRNYLYWLSGRIGEHTLQQAVKHAIKLMSYEAVVKNVLKMPTVWGIVRTPAGATYEDDLGHEHQGSGGWWPPSMFT